MVDTETPCPEEITVDEYVRAWRPGPHQLVDVREPDEYAEGHLPGAVLLPLGDLTERAGELDPAVPTVLVCRSGRRSLIATEYLRERGFARPVNLAGGVLAWAEAGQPLAG